MKHEYMDIQLYGPGDVTKVTVEMVGPDWRKKPKLGDLITLRIVEIERRTKETL